MIIGHIGGGAVDQGYQIEKSLRTRGNSGNRLSFTFGARTSGTTGTLSMWIKRGKLGVVQFFLAGSNYEFIQFLADDTLRISGPGSKYWITSKKFRDPSAHMHLHIAWDTTQAVAANRCRVWVNLEEITEWSSKPDITQNSAFVIWNTAGNVGTLFGSAYFNQNFDGHGSEVHWLDGQYLPPTDFAELDANGVCVPKKYTGGNYGNNGFYLDFKDGTSLTTLGYDKSGNNNHWTLNGYSLTAGATYDWMDDTPTNNFAVLNAVHAGRSTLTNGNLTASGSTDLPTIIPSSGTWYFERAGVAQTWTPPAAFPAGAGDYNFGQRPFSGSPTHPTLCTKNLPLGGSITTSGSFTGNANANGPFVWLNGDPVSMTINGNAVTWGTHADRTAGGFKVRTSSASYNASGTNNYVVTITGNLFGDEIYAPNTAKGNP